VEGISKNVKIYADGIMAAQGGSAIDRKAKVNTMLHLALDHLDQFSPGNLYIFPKRHRTTFMPPLNDVLKDCAKGNHQEQTMAEHGRLVALEITPLCDFAQKKMGLSRVMSGFVLPHEDSALVKGGQFLKVAGPFFFRSSRTLPAGPYSIYLNARFSTSARVQDIEALTPVARVRSQFLADVQAWASYQGARQGVVMLK
jgi:hypothetical protein